MGFEVDPDTLRAAAGSMALLPGEIDRAPHLGADPVAAKLKGSSVGMALSGSDGRSRTAKDVLRARFNQFSALLALSADKFQNTDADAANRLAAVADINSGDPHGGR
ncbi:hypothetical protein [Nocardia beijingensis]